MNAEDRRHLREILDRHNDLARAFRRTTESIDATQDGLEQAGRAVREATHAIREAAAAMIAANTAALALYQDTDEDGDR